MYWISKHVFDGAVMTLRVAESDEKYVLAPLDLVASLRGPIANRPQDGILDAILPHIGARVN
jgi:hypothetical protein